jgi:hypothetical protein
VLTCSDGGGRSAEQSRGTVDATRRLLGRHGPGPRSRPLHTCAAAGAVACALVTEARTKESWELAAEKLVGDVRRLLDHHDALVKALGKSLGKNEARSRLRQIEALVEAMEIELWRAGTVADKTMVGGIATTLKKGLAAVAIAVPATLTTLAATDAYNAWTAADAQADRVIECVIEADEPIGDAAGSGSIEDTLDAALGARASADVIDGGADAREPTNVIDAGDGATLRSDVIDAGAEVHPPKVVQVETAVERDDALPITPTRTVSAVSESTLEPRERAWLERIAAANREGRDWRPEELFADDEAVWRAALNDWEALKDDGYVAVRIDERNASGKPYAVDGVRLTRKGRGAIG